MLPRPPCDAPPPPSTRAVKLCTDAPAVRLPLACLAAPRRLLRVRAATRVTERAWRPGASARCAWRLHDRRRLPRRRRLRVRSRVARVLDAEPRRDRREDTARLAVAARSRVRRREPWATGTEPSGAIREAGFVALVTTPQGVAFAPDAPTATGHDVVLAHGTGAAGKEQFYAVWRDAEAIELASPRATASRGRAPRSRCKRDDGSPLGAPILAAGKTALYVMYGDGSRRACACGRRTTAARRSVPTTTPLAGTYGNAIGRRRPACCTS